MECTTVIPSLVSTAIIRVLDLGSNPPGAWDLSSLSEFVSQAQALSSGASHRGAEHGVRPYHEMRRNLKRPKDPNLVTTMIGYGLTPWP